MFFVSRLGADAIAAVGLTESLLAAMGAVWMTALCNLCFLGVTGLALMLGARRVVAISTADPAVARYARDGLRLVAGGFAFCAYGLVVTQSFNGAGDTVTPTWLNLLVFWGGEIPAAWLLAGPFGMGPRGVFLSIVLAFSALAVASVALFRRGRWKVRMV